MSGGGFLLLRRHGATWAIARPEVAAVARRPHLGSAFEVRVAAGGALAADEVLGLAPELRLSPAGAVLRRYWPEAARGLAVHGASPLVVVDPLAPPAALLATPPPAALLAPPPPAALLATPPPGELLAPPSPAALRATAPQEAPPEGAS